MLYCVVFWDNTYTRDCVAALSELQHLRKIKNKIAFYKRLNPWREAYIQIIKACNSVRLATGMTMCGIKVLQIYGSFPIIIHLTFKDFSFGGGTHLKWIKLSQNRHLGIYPLYCVLVTVCVWCSTICPLYILACSWVFSQEKTLTQTFGGA